jgi:hypothetical protein
MPWTVTIRKRAAAEIPRLPKRVQESLIALLNEIEHAGPVRGNWPNYSKLSATRHHCHLKKGHPTYVAVWEMTTAAGRRVEVTYVGTHEKAPY